MKGFPEDASREDILLKGIEIGCKSALYAAAQSILVHAERWDGLADKIANELMMYSERLDAPLVIMAASLAAEEGER